MSLDDALRRGQADAESFEIILVVQTLESAEQPACR